MAALRNLARNRLYAGINIVGLSVGFAAAILMALFVRSEFNYDTFFPEHDRIFNVAEIYHVPGGPPIPVDATLPSIAAAMKLDYPSIDTIARLAQGGADLRVGTIEALDGITWVDPDFFKVMPLPVIAGDPIATLARPDGIVLTRSMARKYFGRIDPTGETMELDRAHRMQVGAVIEDIPANSHLAAQMFASGLASFSPLAIADRADRGNWGDTVYTYFRLVPGASVDAIGGDMAAFLERHGSIGPQSQVHLTPPALELIVVPLAAIHLRPAALAAMTPRANIETLLALAATAGLIVLIAAINYTTLMTARSTQRAVEVGIRKVVGAARRSLVAQFIGESLLYVVIAMAAAVACVELIIPSLNAYAMTKLEFDYWRDPMLLGALAALVLIVGVLAGLYPAVVLSAFRPASVLKGGALQSVSAGVVRTGLVVLQFAILIGILLMTATIYRQTRFALTETLRVPTDQIMWVTGACDDAIKHQIRSLPGVRAAACSAPGAFSHVLVHRTDGANLAFSRTLVDFGYFETYGLRPVAGRFFEKNYGADFVSPDAPASFQPNVVINETARQQLGFQRSAEAVGKTVSWVRGADLSAPLPSTIIGVAPDFSVTASRAKIDPEIYLVDPSWLDTLNIKLDGDKIPETIAAIDRLWKKFNASRPISREFLDQRMQHQYMDVIRQGVIFTAFSGLGLFLACLGLFGLAAFATERRIKEIGIRKAMGASSADIMRLFVWEFSRPVLWANLIAWPIAYYCASRWLNGFAYHVNLELWMFLAAGTIALTIALVTVSGQAFLAARAKPVRALRYE
jgi:putative ABC transport system permease protein